MKSNHSHHQHKAPPKGQSTVAADHGKPATSPRVSAPIKKDSMSQFPEQSSTGPLPYSPNRNPMHPRAANLSGQETATLETMRKRMSEALAQKQMKMSGTSPTASPKALLAGTERLSDQDLPTMSSNPSLATSGTISTDSAKTVRATFDLTPGPMRTPSYPFPRMQMKLQRGMSSRSGPHHKPFTLLSPTSEPPEAFSSGQTPTQQASSELSTPIGLDPSQTMPDDANYPTPDLYDMVLMLSTEPGLESWWANVTEILSEAYGAERASLALPGDVTDLENVPWGQKATFNIYGSETGGSFAFDSNTTSEMDVRSMGKTPDMTPAMREVFGAGRRPPLHSRHSIAGVQPDTIDRSAPMRPAAPIRAISSIPGPREDRSGGIARPKLIRQSPTPQSVPTLEETREQSNLNQESTGSLTSTCRFQIWRTLQPLEAEPDPLLVRTGVAGLFGKRKPVILTRAYSDEQPPSPGAYFGSRGESDNGAAPSIISKPDSRLSARTATSYTSRAVRPFDEYEQPEPSPWAQSPSPSPAARPDPTESPFFNTSATIDEDAFAQNPPNYDYGLTANQPLNAIGTDMSRTLVHIPLIQPVPSRSVLASSLRFPIAILSFLSPVTPYPRNLRHSLANLLPHLAGTFSIAQQYSLLQDRLRGGPNRRSAAFGLGGTFSDEGSELELVTELSSQLNLNRDQGKSSSFHGSVYSPSEATSTSKDSITGSIVNTPFLDHLGMNVGYPNTPGTRSGTEMIDSYFSAKRTPKFSQHASSPGPKLASEDSSEKSRSRDGKPLRTRSSTKKISGPTKLVEKSVNPPGARKASVESDITDMDSSPMADRTGSGIQPQPQHRDSVIRIDDNEKPLPELISSMVLNAVPLQLFLARPTTGDLVWTNRKFDAFRSQGEGRVRDPWKNVHPDDRDSIEKSWIEALKNGSQFTHYVRVKRFNSDYDYRWFVFRASTLLSSSGRLSYWIGSFLDFHEQYLKNLEASEKEATMARDAKIRALADAIPQILFEAVEGEGIVSVNQQWHSFAGQTLDEARGLGFARQVHRDDLYKCGVLTPHDVTKAQLMNTRSPSTSSSSSSSNKTAHPTQAPVTSPKSIFTPDSNSLNTMIRQGALIEEKDENGRTSYSTEIRLRSKGGEFRWHLIRLVKVQHELLNNGKASWYGTCTDIETRMGLERELNAANKKVNSEMESKTKFFANMSHEIRTPLNGILGSMPWLVESALDHDQRRTVDTIQNSANNLRELVDNILDVTKVEAGKMTLLPKWFHVRSLCEEVVDTVSSRAIERGLELNYSLDVNLPTMVMGDPFRIRQVMLNLMGNSVKFTEQGEVYLHCRLHGETKPVNNKVEGFLAFDVVDTGRGFNETEFKRLFKQFGQIEGANQHESGSGLGLFLSKQLVEMHGGELSVQSKAGEGSTFSFYVKVQLPAPGAEVSSPNQGMRPRQRQSVSFSTGGSRSSSDAKTPTMASTQGVSAFSKPSPEVMSPGIYVGGSASPMASPGSSTTHSLRSNSGTIALASSVSSMVVTPDSFSSTPKAASTSDRQLMVEKAAFGIPQFKRSKSDNDGSGLVPELGHPEIYSIVVICPAEHARIAIKQHIEHVVPHQIPAHVTTLKDIGSFLDLMHGPASPTFTHIVLDLPASSDIMLFLRQMLNFTASIIPALVVITDHYQKRDIFEDFSTLTSSGRKAFLVHKPVKPSVFAMIFDPAQLRQLSKDRAREVVQTGSDDFRKTVSHVKETIGNKGFRILLVEDSDMNRMVIARYLRRVGLASEEARDGQECIDKVLAQPHDYYNLIICDIQMPRKNGYQTCTEIRQWERNKSFPPVPIMALTANAMPEERAAAGNAGFTDYLTKPVDFNHLGAMMIGLLDRNKPHVFLKDIPLDS